MSDKNKGFIEGLRDGLEDKSEHSEKVTVARQAVAELNLSQEELVELGVWLVTESLTAPILEFFEGLLDDE